MTEADRRAVFVRAGGRCEYCRLPLHQTFAPWQVEHIIARQHRGTDAPSNLALSCIWCNASKGPNIAGLDPHDDALTRLFHPRRDTWADHFRWDGSLIDARTSIGRVTLYVLDMNRSDLVGVRDDLRAIGQM